MVVVTESPSRALMTYHSNNGVARHWHQGRTGPIDEHSDGVKCKTGCDDAIYNSACFTCDHFKLNYWPYQFYDMCSAVEVYKW